MLDINITIKSPELVEALNTLAKAIGTVEAPAKETPAKPELKPEPEPKKEAVETVTIEQVRPVLAELVKAKGTDSVKDLFNTYGADKLSAVTAENLPKLFKDAKALL